MFESRVRYILKKTVDTKKAALEKTEVITPIKLLVTLGMYWVSESDPTFILMGRLARTLSTMRGK
jgi:hypothetical protein